MALLADDELDPVQPSDTNPPFFDDGDYKPRDKKDKKRFEDKRGSVRTLPWVKSKDSTLEKTPKKGKHNRNKSGSRTPPDSPKATRSEDFRRPSKPIPTQPSPNVKSNRKSYSQLDDVSDEDQPDTEGYTMSNRPVLATEQGVTHNNPWVSMHEPQQNSPPTASSPPKTSDPPADTLPVASDPWSLQSPDRRATVQFPVLFGGSGQPAMSPDKQRGSLQLGPAQPTKDIPSPSREHSSLTSYQPFTALPPPPQPLAPPPSQLPTATSASASEPDWSISDELRDKCVAQFKDLSKSSGYLQGDKAREFFVLSKLPNQELSAIWRLSDVDKDNALSELEFCVAMKLVMMRRKGHEIPSTLPEVLLSSTLPRTFSDFTDIHKKDPQKTSSPVLSETESEPDPSSLGGTNTGVLVDLGGDSGDWDSGGDEDTALVFGEGGASDKSATSKQKATKTKTVQAPSPTPHETGKTSPTDGLLINIDEGTPQVSRKTAKKRDYTTLDSSASSPIEPLDESSTDAGFSWKQLDNKVLPGLETPVVEAVNRGHHRGKSLDLNKMIKADHSKDVLEDLPSAVPPKPPPRPHHSPPLEASRNSTTQSGDEEGGERKGGRVRSLSTGSISKPTSPDPHEGHGAAELETHTLIKDKPKTRKLRPAPRRPPPPVIQPKTAPPPPAAEVPSKADLKEYQVPGGDKPKSKKELQSTIRSLKDQNALLTEFNKNLEAQLFKLMEERVKLERELDTQSIKG